MHAIATVCADTVHTSRVRRIARRRKLTVLYISGTRVFVPPDKSQEAGRVWLDSSFDSQAFVSSVREKIKELDIDEIEFHPSPDEPKQYIYGELLAYASKRRAKLVIVERKPDPQPP